jgi:hypothetical protein
MVIWYIFSHFGILYQEKSGNPGYYRVILEFHLSKNEDNFREKTVVGKNGRNIGPVGLPWSTGTGIKIFLSPALFFWYLHQRRPLKLF